ncbi:MAG: hypothetical protein JWP38_1120 [Herbaspirillum sp.]|nr:hypothetical protein [Herbaspirillum sp.]
MADANTGISFKTIETSLGDAARAADETFEKEMQAYNAKTNPSTADMSIMQQSVQKWTMANELLATVNKEAGDVFKEFIQKS